MADILIFDSLNRILWIITIFLLLACGIFFFYRAKKIKTSKDRFLLYGFSAIFIGLALQRLFFFISDYYATGYYIGDEYYGFYNILDPTYTNLVATGYLFFFISMTISFVMFEHISESQYQFTVISFIALMTFLAMPISYKVTLRYILIVINGILLLAILIRLLKMTDKKFQFIIKLIFISLILYVIGSLADSGPIKQLGSPSIPIVFFIASALIGLSAMVLNTDKEK